jgi:hypothetical protein
MRWLHAAPLLMAALVAACATLPPSPPARTPSAAEKEEARRTFVAPYLACMQAEGRKAGGVEASELRCGHHIQQLRRYGASKDYDALRWSDYIEQIERDGRTAATR